MKADRFWKDCWYPWYRGVRYGAVPSEEFTKYYLKGVCRHVGRTQFRQPRYGRETFADPTVSSWKSCRDFKWEQKYGMAVANAESNFKSSSKYEKYQPDVDEEAMDLSLKWTGQHFGPHMMGSLVVDRDVAVMNAAKTTSPGFGIKEGYPTKGPYLASPIFPPIHDAYWRHLRSRDPIPTFWSLNDKYELRSLEKLKENKIRSFTASAVHHSIANSQLCLDMNEKFYRSALRTASFVGATKFRGGWNKAIRKLLKFRMGFALDESDFDASLFRRLLWGQCVLRCEFLKHKSEENLQAMHNLYYDIINSIMITPKGDVVVKNTGNPSGQGNTIVDNTMILYRLLCYAFIVLWKKKHNVSSIKEYDDKLENLRMQLDGRAGFGDGDLEQEYERLSSQKLTYKFLNDNVEMVLNGDDNTFSVCELIIDWFNARGIADVWTSIGVTTKSDCWDPRPVEELDFLSHTSRYDEESRMYLPVPEKSRIMDSLLLGSKSPDVRWSYLRACALRIESWADNSPGGLREMLQDYIEYLHKYHSSELVGDVRVPGSKEYVKWEDIQNTYFSDQTLSTLYSGYESESGFIEPDIKSALWCLSHVMTRYSMQSPLEAA